MELPNTFGLHIQASRAETLANVYIGNLPAIENRPNRLAGFDPKGGDGDLGVGISLTAVSRHLPSRKPKPAPNCPNACSLSFRAICLADCSPEPPGQFIKRLCLLTQATVRLRWEIVQKSHKCLDRRCL